MNDPNFKELFLSIQRCDAVYEPNEDKAIAAFEELGSTVIGRISTDDNQAILSRPSDGVLTLTISGTRVSEGSFEDHIHDLFQDIDCHPFNIGSGRLVAHQPFNESSVLYSWVKSRAPNESMRIEGHSLGGWKSTYSPEYLDVGQVISITAWESPKQGNDSYWSDINARGFLEKFTQVYHGKDPWSLWPWECSTLRKGPKPILWAHDNTWEWAEGDKLPIADLLDFFELPHSRDHGPSSVVETFRVLSR